RLVSSPSRPPAEFHLLHYDGIFTPPSVQGTLVFPGDFDIFEWGGTGRAPAKSGLGAARTPGRNLLHLGFTLGGGCRDRSRLAPQAGPLGQFRAGGGVVGRDQRIVSW